MTSEEDRIAIRSWVGKSYAYAQMTYKGITMEVQFPLDDSFERDMNDLLRTLPKILTSVNAEGFIHKQSLGLDKELDALLGDDQ